MGQHLVFHVSICIKIEYLKVCHDVSFKDRVIGMTQLLHCCYDSHLQSLFTICNNWHGIMGGSNEGLRYWYHAGVGETNSDTAS